MSQNGTLYVIATPIGNLQDITLRAIEMLKEVDLIVCEDTRITSRLLTKYEIKKPMVAVSEFNEEQVVYDVINKLETQNIALVSDAGTPLISDPGYRIVNTAKKKGFSVVPIPGPSAVIAALSASGLPTDKFVFLGFLSKSEAKATKNLEVFKTIETTIALYESPHRIVETLEIIQKIFGDIPVTIARELTKIYEEIITENATTHIQNYREKEPRGEIVVLFSTKH